MLTLGWMRSYQVPDQYRVDLAQTLLCGTALYHWHHREELLGHERDWDAFTADLAGFFDEVDRRTVWNRRAGSFSQHPGETIRAYTDRFYGVIVGTYPLPMIPTCFLCRLTPAESTHTSSFLSQTSTYIHS